MMLSVKGIFVGTALSLLSGLSWAEERVWATFGAGPYDGGDVGASLGMTVMGERWGGSFRLSQIMDPAYASGCLVTGALNLLIDDVDPACDHGAAEGALMLNMALYEGRVIAAVGVSEVKFYNAGRVGDNRYELGMPWGVTWRSKSGQNIGVSASLQGNINEYDSFVGLNLQFELGGRY